MGSTFREPVQRMVPLASSPYVGTLPGPESVSAPVETYSYTNRLGKEVLVPASRLGEFLPPLSVLQYFDQNFSQFDASRFCHRMRFSDNLFNKCVGGLVQFSCEKGWLKRWLHWRGRGATGCRSAWTQIDSTFLQMHEEVEYEGWMSVMVAWFKQLLDSTNFDVSSHLPDLIFCYVGRPLDYYWYDVLIYLAGPPELQSTAPTSSHRCNGTCSTGFADWRGFCRTSFKACPL